MRLRRLLPAPGWSARWWAGATLLGFVLPAVLATMLMLLGYTPLGSVLPRSIFWTEFGPVLAIEGAAVIILVGAFVYSLMAWNWRPLLLVLMLEGGGVLGFVPGFIGGQYVRDWALELFSHRSLRVIEAVAGHTRSTGKPPETLAELVPGNLPSFPKTGMAQAPDYIYEANSGLCSIKNEWNLQVLVQDFFSVHRLLYCPEQDYAVSGEKAYGAWRYELVDP